MLFTFDKKHKFKNNMLYVLRFKFHFINHPCVVGISLK